MHRDPSLTLAERLFFPSLPKFWKTRLFGLTLQFLIGKLYGKMKMRADVYFSPEMYVEC